MFGRWTVYHTESAAAAGALIAPGVVLILLGILIFIFPRILVAAVAGVLIAAGLMLVSAGLGSRRGSSIDIWRQ